MASFKAQPHIEALIPYVPGKPVEELQRELGLEKIYKLASNENPLGPSPKALEAMAEAIQKVHFYPDGGAFSFKEALARHHGLAPNRFFVSNGSNEGLQLLVRALKLPGTKAVFSAGSFIIYKLACLGGEVPFDEVPLAEDLSFDLEAIAAKIDASTRFLFLTNPNNPTGTYFNRDAFETLMEKVPETCIVVMDEAYFDFVEVEDYPNGVKLQERYPNVVAMRTFSKSYGLAGLRVGYGVAHPEIVSLIDRVRDPFNVNLVAQQACIAAIEDVAFLKKTQDVNRAGMTQLVEGVKEMGLPYVPSVTNFFLVKLPMEGKRFFDLLLRKGVIVRPMAGYKLPMHVRVSVGLEHENAAFLKGTREILEAEGLL